ncbi:HEPN domain-containing protein [Rhizobium terrae]|uniref:HEPN domain-containing protein n=1 Tax=Rhizobium terrae TaxID=2171756 RepID=UPI000E3D5C18|nr:HEPN domain-containing protein [Rhizobium terrae]
MTPGIPDHLPERKQRELSFVMQIIFEEFDTWQSGKSEKKCAGKILKLILFGSFARGDWVEDSDSGYRSDFDLLAVVNIHSFAEEHEIWSKIDDRLTREYSVLNRLQTPVKVIAHSLQDVNDQLARGVPFFFDIAKDGVVLFEEPGHPLATPKPLTREAKFAEAQQHYDHWLRLSQEAYRGAEMMLGEGIWRDASFMLHQATERAYHCLLLVITLYSPKSHRLKMLRSMAERIEPRLIGAWPRDTKFARRCFERLDRAYVDARYSPHYEITSEELAWVLERIKDLQTIVKVVCQEHLTA